MAHVKSGDRIKKSQLPMEYCMDMIRERGCPTVVPVLVTNADNFAPVSMSVRNHGFRIMIKILCENRRKHAMKKTIVVVGAGKGLGNAVAEKFGENDFRVVLMARNGERLREYAEAFAAKGIEVYTHPADASDFAGFTAAFQDVTELYGMPDVLFYNVGITTPDDSAAMNAETLMDRYAIDVAGAYNCVRLVDTPEFAEKKGAILVTGGGLALQPYAGYLPLSMDKAALRAMVQALSPVLREKGIYIGTVQVTQTIGSTEHYAPHAIAEEFWKLYQARETSEMIY